MRRHERDVQRVATELGLTVRRPRRGGHLHLIDDAGRLVAVVSATPRRADYIERMLRADVRRRMATLEGS